MKSEINFNTAGAVISDQ